MKMVKTVLILALLTLSTFCDTVESDIQGNMDGGATEFQEIDPESSEQQWVYLDEPHLFANPYF